MKKKFTIGTSIPLLLSFSCLAQTNDSIQTLQLSEINVVATRIEKNNIETPSSITVITSDQIVQSGYTSIADALSETPGIYITGTGQNPGANESIFMRGANSNQTVIIVDGIRISDASTVNNTADLSEIQISTVDRIEIIRGSQGTLYGTGAVGGVVYITTKNNDRNGLIAKAGITGGTFGKKTFDSRANARLGYRFRKGIYAVAGIEKNLVSGADATIDSVTDPSVFKNRDRDDFDKLYYYAKAGYNHQSISTELNYAVTNIMTDLDKGAYVDDDNYLLNFKRNLITGNIGWKPGGIFSVQLSAGYTDTERHSENDSSIVDEAGTFDHSYFENTYSGKNVSSELQMNAHFENADLLIGLSGNSEDMNQEDYIFSTAFGLYESRTKLDSIPPVNTISAYVHGQVKGSFFSQLFKRSGTGFADRLTLSGGARISNHSLIGSGGAFDLSLSAKTGENTLIYLTHATGFNNPSLYQIYAPERYVPWDSNPTTGLTRGNSSLDPESAQTFEIGFKQNQGSRFQYSVSFFHSVTKNLIEYVYLWDSAIGADTLGNDPWNRDDYRGDRYLNIGKQTTTGLEIDLHTDLSEKFSFSANATLLAGKIEYNRSSSITSQTNGEHLQLYSNGAFLTTKTKTGSLIRRPGEANLKLTYIPVSSLSVAFSLRFVTARNDVYYDGSLGPFGALSVNVVDAYTLAGLTVNWKAGKKINLNIRGENLLNEKYEEIHGFSTKRRSLYVSIGYTY